MKYSFTWTAAAAAKSRQSCPTLCDPIDGSPPGSPVPGILQARTLEWVAISFSNEGKWKAKVKSLSCVRLFTTPWTAAYQARVLESVAISFSNAWKWKVKVKSLSRVWLLRPWDFPGKSTGVGCHCLLQFNLYSKAISLSFIYLFNFY